MKERITDLEVLGRDYQAIRHAIDRINLLTEKPGRGDWPERFKLEKLEGQEFLDKAVSVGKVARTLKEETLPRLMSKEEQIRQKVERLEEQVAEIQQLAQSGFLDQTALARAQKILEKVKEPKLVFTYHNSIQPRPAENTIIMNAKRRKKADLALAIEAAIQKVAKKPFYTIKDIATATERELDTKLRKFIYKRIRENKKSGNPKWTFPPRSRVLRFGKYEFKALVMATLTAKRIMYIRHTKSTAKEIFTTSDQHQMPRFKSEEYNNIIELLLNRRQTNGRVYTEELINLLSGSKSLQTPLKKASNQIHRIRVHIKPFGWVIDTNSEYFTKTEKKKSSYSYSLRRRDEKSHDDNALAPIPPVIVFQEAPVGHEAVVQPIEASAADDQSERWWKDNMPDKTTYTTEDFLYALVKQKGKENLTLVYVSMGVTHIKLKLGILGQHLSKSRRLYYQKEDARKIMKALLAMKTTKRGNRNQINPLSQTEMSTSGRPGTLTLPLKEPGRLLSYADNPEEDQGKTKTEEIKKQLIENFTDIILSHLVSPDVLKGLENNPDKLLRNTLKFISESYTVGQIILPTDKMFFAESFAKRLEEVWNKASEFRQLSREQSTIDSLGQMGKEQKTIDFCNELFRRRYAKEMIIKIVCDHFHVPIPQKSKEQQSTFSQGH